MYKSQASKKQKKSDNIWENFDPQTYVRDGVTESEILKMKECFQAFDTDQSGALDLNELKDSISEMGMNMQSERLLKMVEECDANGDGEMQFDEFLQWMGVYDQSRMLIEDDKIEGLFEIATQGRDKITQEDFKRLSQEVHANYTEEELNDMLLSADSDKDGVINLQEFVHIITKDYNV